MVLVEAYEISKNFENDVSLEKCKFKRRLIKTIIYKKAANETNYVGFCMYIYVRNQPP